MKIKLTDQGKKRIADILSSVLIKEQQIIQAYVKANPVKDSACPTINFDDPTCHLITWKDCSGSGRQVTDSLSDTFFLLTDKTSYTDATIRLTACLVFPVNSLGLDSSSTVSSTIQSQYSSALSIAARQYCGLVHEVLRPAIKEHISQLGLPHDISAYSFGYSNTKDFLGLFTDAGFSYTHETQLFLTTTLTIPLADSDYTPV